LGSENAISRPPIKIARKNDKKGRMKFFKENFFMRSYLSRLP
jgi:hypothetical protein